MEIRDKNTERSTIIIAVMTLMIIGLTLLFSTWQTMKHQTTAEEEHLLLTSRSVLLALENSLRRGPREGKGPMSAEPVELFEQMEQEGDILFAGIIDDKGGRLFTSSIKNEGSIELPTQTLKTLFGTGEWHGRLFLGETLAYVYARRMNMGRGGRMMMHADTPTYLLVGIDVEKNLHPYKGMRQSVLFQAIYIFAAALFMWALALAFLARREQANKAGRLEQFQATLLDNLPDGLITLQRQEEEVIIQSANPAALLILQQQGAELLGKNITALPPAVAACIVNRDQFHCPSCWQSITVGNTNLEIRTLPLLEAGNNSFMMLLRDRTQLRQLEKSLAEAEKLAVIGSLAAGVAHEVRNPLSALRGFAQYFVKKLVGQHPEEEYARTMVQEADRLNRVITDLLYLAKPKDLYPKDIHLPALLDEVDALLRFDLEKKGITLKRNLLAEHVMADADALKQILLNLMLNSIDAVMLQAEGQRTITVEAYPSASGVHVQVSDTGCGMTPQQREQAFEPFFTGKEHGTGLGLALVQRLMHEHGGKASIKSDQSKGCTITLEFTQPQTQGQ